MENIILCTDSYKLSHYRQYPPNTKGIYSYFESRGVSGERPDLQPRTLFFGLQYIIKKHLTGARVTQEMIDEAAVFSARHFGSAGVLNITGWSNILRRHGGRLPVRIAALREGTIAPCGTALITIENTDPEFYWLPNYLETLLVQTWYPTTVASQSLAFRKTISEYLDKTGGGDFSFKLHDFGFRGVSSVETAAIGGAAHLAAGFRGSDTIAGVEMLNKYYARNLDEPMAGFSIPAAEHSTLTSWGRNREVDAYRNMLEQFPTGLVAVVSDSYNIFDACANIWGGALKDKVLARDGMLTIRPDSGDPVETLLTGIRNVMAILADKFGTTTNEAGFKVLNKVRVIQGDGIDLVTVQNILSTALCLGYAADNFVFGSGGALLQKLNRDTFKFAFKCSSADVDCREVPVYKDPVTDHGKRSKRGKFDVVCDGYGDLVTIAGNRSANNALECVFENGELRREQNFHQIRQLVDDQLANKPYQECAR